MLLGLFFAVHSGLGVFVLLRVPVVPLLLYAVLTGPEYLLLALFPGPRRVSGIPRVRIAGVVLLVFVCAGLLTRITDHTGSPPKNPDHPSVELRAVENQPITETVDPRNGNLRVQIPIRATRQKPTVPRSGH
jgi:hypothetical protein